MPAVQATAFEFLDRKTEKGSPDLVFTYRVHFADAEPLDFEETITLSDPNWQSMLPMPFRTAILEDLHLILGVSYYKAFCPPQMRMSIKLSHAQADFWNSVYENGLGEFLYRNSLSPSIIAKFAGQEVVTRQPVSISTDVKKVLVGIGGGKDSIVALELLKEYECTGFIKETGRENKIARDVAKVAGVPLTIVSRKLDQKVLEGVPGSYNGHIPISAIYAFLGILEAALGGQQHVVVANEHSSNFGNLMHEGNEINHKWSGSSEFEILFQEYVRENLTPSIRYFSLTRPFYELRVVKLFTELGEKYFDVFSSCNRNFAHDDEMHGACWCGECPKCAFTFLMLSAFLSKEEVVGIFKKNLLEDEALVPMYRDLLGLGDLKPFDCVGTFDESKVALKMAERNGWGETRIVKEFVDQIGDVSKEKEEVRKTQKAVTVPTRFRMLGMESALILGYGREGHASENYLKARFPALKVGIADEKDGEGYLSIQEEYDIVIKTPVIPEAKVTRQHTTATHFFFKDVAKEQIIGITGSKGKSTTSTLIYEVLRAAGKEVRLVGNIGVPAIQNILENPVKEGELFVFELSSYQLEDIDVSPHVAVLTSLFPEHLDHHGSLDAYYDAKRNIVRFQEENDAFVYHGDEELVTKWTDKANGTVIPAATGLPFEVSNKSLRGEHNVRNIELVYTVARMFGVEDAVIENVVENFEGLPHRLMYVGNHKGIEFYDDSMAGNPPAAIAALRALERVDTIILGGEDRGLDFTDLETELRNKGVKTLVLFPDTGERMLSSEEGFVVLHTANMEEAVKFGYENTPEGGTVLLSPASPSYNLFVNFEDRGQQFIEAVKKYDR